jgi:hypothetical protein
MYFLIQLFLLINLEVSFSGSYEYVPVGKYPVSADYVDVDALGNIYTIKDNVITKYTGEFKKSCSYFNPLFGKVNSFDNSDPFKIIVFYKDFNLVVQLDNTLTEIQQPIKLDDLGLYSIELVCNSLKNGIWLLNAESGKIEFLTNDLQISYQSVDLNSILQGNFNPTYLSERNLNLFLQVPEKGMLLFDQFANYNSIIPILTTEKIGISDELIYYSESDSVTFYNAITGQQQKFDLPIHSDNKQIIIKKNRLYIFSENLLSIYEIKL